MSYSVPSNPVDARILELAQTLPAPPIALSPAATVNVPVANSQVYTLVVGALDTVDIVPTDGAFVGSTCWILLDNSAGGTATIDGGAALEGIDQRVSFIMTDTGTYDAIVGAAL